MRKKVGVETALPTRMSEKKRPKGTFTFFGTGGLNLEPFHQPFFVKDFSK
jgi:hypothetical protein